MEQHFEAILNQLSEFMTEQELETLRTLGKGREQEALGELLFASQRSKGLLAHAQTKGLPGSELKLVSSKGGVKMQTKKHGRGEKHRYTTG